MGSFRPTKSNERLFCRVHKCRLNRSRCRLGMTHVGPRNNVLDGVKVGQIHLPPRGVTKRRCGLSSKFVDHLYLLCTSSYCSLHAQIPNYLGWLKKRRMATMSQKCFITVLCQPILKLVFTLMFSSKVVMSLQIPPYLKVPLL